MLTMVSATQFTPPSLMDKLPYISCGINMYTKIADMQYIYTLPFLRIIVCIVISLVFVLTPSSPVCLIISHVHFNTCFMEILTRTIGVAPYRPTHLERHRLLWMTPSFSDAIQNDIASAGLVKNDSSV